MINIKKDAHIHTKYSPDADKDATFDTYTAKAKECGIEELIFTDHLDLDPAHPLFKNPIDYTLYFKDYNQRNRIDGVTTKIGIEIGYQPHTIQETMNIVNSYPFEYVILSIHYIDKMDLYTKEFFQGKTKKEAYQRYFELCLEAIQNTPRFDTFGHLDYIPRYSELGDFDFEDYKDIIDKVLIELIQRNKNLEINTSGFLTENRQYPQHKIINRYIELGGKKLILGSDSHRVSELGRYFDLVQFSNVKINI